MLSIMRVDVLGYLCTLVSVFRFLFISLFGRVWVIGVWLGTYRDCVIGLRGWCILLGFVFVILCI